MKIFIMPNITRVDAKRVTDDICKKLRELNADFWLADEHSEYFAGSGAKFAPLSEILPNCDVIIAVGGDGSIIRAAKEAIKYAKPVLGVNAGRLAFMAGLEDNELQMLSNLIDGNYKTDKRLVLKVTVKNAERVVSTGYAINECFISNGEKQRMTTINAGLNGTDFSGYLCDGIIVATPTGSTAYSLSAGGPVVDPELESIIFTPVCPHSLVGRSIIFRPDDVITISSGEDKSMYCSTDGKKPLCVPGDCVVEISRAEFTADFIRIKSDNFIDILYSKLAQRR